MVVLTGVESPRTYGRWANRQSGTVPENGSDDGDNGGVGGVDTLE